MNRCPDNADTIVLGAGAAGLLCASTAAYRGRRVLLLDHASRPGRKILMSGGGRCNFTNLDTTPAHFQSANPDFCISALRRYTPYDFVDLIERHGVSYHHKTPGQLFCDTSSRDILRVLLTECEWAGVQLCLGVTVEDIDTPTSGRFSLRTNHGILECETLVIATGGLSIPTMGASGFGYQIAEQFGLHRLPTRPGLVPLTAGSPWKERFSTLSGLSIPVRASSGGQGFDGPLLFTHRGLSGPPILQISSYWKEGEALQLDWWPDAGNTPSSALHRYRQQYPARLLEHYLASRFPRRLASVYPLWDQLEDAPLQHLRAEQIVEIENRLRCWTWQPSGTEGYRTAEVTLGGVDTRALSSKTMAVRDQQNLFFIGEVVDVTGQLGGYNFQWAWASAVAAGRAC